MANARVRAARARKRGRAGETRAEVEWFIDQFNRRTDVTLKQRMHVAVAFLQDAIVRNISVPVMKVVSPRTGRTVVTERSRPGEFPRTDTTTLRKSIFWDVVDHGGGRITGHVGTPVWYALPLELEMDRRFLTRTMEENHSNLVRILTGPIL